jgi:hypothetical protein
VVQWKVPSDCSASRGLPRMNASASRRTSSCASATARPTTSCYRQACHHPEGVDGHSSLRAETLRRQCAPARRRCGTNSSQRLRLPARAHARMGDPRQRELDKDEH